MRREVRHLPAPESWDAGRPHAPPAITQLSALNLTLWGHPGPLKPRKGFWRPAGCGRPLLCPRLSHALETVPFPDALITGFDCPLPGPSL